MSANDQPKFEGQFSFKLPKGEQDAFVANAESIGSTKDIVLRELVRAFNAYCTAGRRPAFPFALAARGYRPEGARLVDATPAEIIDWMQLEEAQMNMGPASLRILHDQQSPEEFRRDAMMLAEMVDAAIRRQAPPLRQVADAPAAYGTHTPRRKPTTVATPKKAKPA